MKKLIFIIYVMISFFQLAQAKGAKKIAQRKDVFESNVWKGKDSFQFVYNQDTLQTFLLALKGNTSSSWDNFYKYTYQYSSSKKILEQVRENWNGSAWVNSTQYLYTYDANDNQILVRYNTWNAGAWKSTGKIEYTGYNAQGNYAKEELFSWNGTGWTNLSYTIINYLSNGIKLNYKESYFWDNIVGWKKDERLVYTYNQDSISSIARLLPDSINAWVYYRKYFYIYGNTPFRLNGLRTQTTFKDTNNMVQWIDTLRTTITYNAANLIEKSLSEDFDSINLWQPKSRTQNIYNTSNELIETFDESYNNFWTNTSRKTFQYNNGNVVEEVQYAGLGSSWNLTKKITFNYNLNDDIVFKQQELFSGIYIPDFREYYYYTDDITSLGNTVQEFTEVKVFPNPSNEIATVEFSIKQNVVVNINLVDAIGTVLTSIVLPVNPGKQQVQIPLSRFSNGQYFIQIKNNISNTQTSMKLMISK